MADYVKCECCNGKGKRKLTGVYADTLRGCRRLFKSREWITAGQYFGWFLCGREALNNRLARLEQLGFLKSERVGRERRYRHA